MNISLFSPGRLCFQYAWLGRHVLRWWYLVDCHCSSNFLSDKVQTKRIALDWIPQIYLAMSFFIWLSCVIWLNSTIWKKVFRFRKLSLTCLRLLLEKEAPCHNLAWVECRPAVGLLFTDRARDICIASFFYQSCVEWSFPCWGSYPLIWFLFETKLTSFKDE